MLADKPATPEDVLKMLLEYEATPEQVLIYGLESKENVMLSVLAENTNLPEKLQKEILKKDDEDANYSLAMNPGASPKILEELGNNKSGRIRQAVARHKSTPKETLKKLLDDIDEYVKGSAISNPSISSDLLAELFEKYENNENLTLYFAKNPSTPEWILRKLYETSLGNCEKALAQNPSTPQIILRKLAETHLNNITSSGYDVNESYTIIYCLAENPSTPIDVLRDFTKEEDMEINYILSCNSAMPEEELLGIDGFKIDDKYEYSRYRIARQTKSGEILTKLYNAANVLEREGKEEHARSIRRALIENPTIPIDWIIEYMEDMKLFKAIICSPSVQRLVKESEEIGKEENNDLAKITRKVKEMAIKEGLISDINGLMERDGDKQTGGIEPDMEP